MFLESFKWVFFVINLCIFRLSQKKISFMMNHHQVEIERINYSGRIEEFCWNVNFQALFRDYMGCFEKNWYAILLSWWKRDISYRTLVLISLSRLTRVMPTPSIYDLNNWDVLIPNSDIWRISDCNRPNSITYRQEPRTLPLNRHANWEFLQLFARGFRGLNTW